MINYRKKTIATIDALINKTNSLLSHHQPTKINKIIHFIMINLQILKNDIVLILNQNFYLRCKLDEASLELQKQYKKLKEGTKHMQLSLQMLKQKYERQIQNVKFNNFYHDYRNNNSNLPQSMLQQFKTILIQKDIQFDKKQQNKQYNQIANTIRKHKENREFKFGTHSKQYIEKQFQDKFNHKQSPSNNADKFDLELRGGLLSQEQTIITNHKISQQLIYSEESSARKRKIRTGKKEENPIQNHRKKKSDQLAELVARQSKVIPIKQQYFSTDLL